MSNSYRLITSCPDNPGIVAEVTRFLADIGATITESNQYSDPVSNWFFMRQVIDMDSIPFDLNEFNDKFSPIADKLSMDWKITDTTVKPKVVLMVSKEAHCLRDLLYRWDCGDLDIDIKAVISNHDLMREYVEFHDIPYYHVPVEDNANKEPHFKEVCRLIDDIDPDVIVLARYMQIIPSWVCDNYAGKIINIHHSFLPSFIGAKPYHQAYERGVKLTGATCHYVTEDLDEGPIIEQDVARISHHDPIEEIVRRGKDVEKAVLARGLRSHIEDRVLTHGNKTIVFD